MRGWEQLRVKLTAKNSSQTLQLHLKSQHMRAGKWHDCGEQQHIPSDPYVEILKGDIIPLHNLVYSHYHSNFKQAIYVQLHT